LNRILHLILLLVFMPSLLFSQHQLWFNTDNGLPTNHIYHIEEDKDGFVWFATNRGILKYDGNYFKPFTSADGLPTNDIWRLEATSNGKVWFFSKSKKMGYVYKDRVFTFPVQGNKVPLIHHFFVNDTAVAFSAESQRNMGIFRCLDGRWSVTDSISLEKYYGSLNKNGLLIPDNRLLLFLNDSIQVHQIGAGLLYPIEGKQFPSKQFSFNKYISYGDILIILNLEHITIVDLLSRSVISKVLFKNKGQYKHSNLPEIQNADTAYQISKSNELFIIDKKMNIIDQKSFAQFDPFVHIFKDSRNNYWTASNDKGICVFPYSSAGVTYFFKDEKVDIVQPIKNELFVAINGKGLFKYNKKTTDFKLVLSETDRIYGYGYHDSFKLFYIYTSSAVYTGHSISDLSETARFYFQPKSSQFSYAGSKAILPASYGFIGITTSFLYKIDENLHFLPSEFLLNPKRSISGTKAFFPFKDSYFIGGDGLFEYNESKDKIAFPKSNHPILTAPVNVIKKYNDNYMVVGTDGFGVYFYDGDKKVIFLEGSNGMIVNDIDVVQKQVWAASVNGIHKYHITDSVYGSFLSDSFYEEDGLLENNVNSIAFSEGYLYVAHDVGLSKINTEPGIYKREVNPYFIGHQVFNDSIQKISYRYGENVDVPFGVLCIPSQTNMRSFYKIDGREKWENLFNSRTISLGIMPPGNYTVELFSIDQHGNSGSAKLSIQILPLWYQTWWFIAIVGILLIVIIISITLFIRRNKEKKIEKDLLLKKALAELELKALRSQMNPHFVFNSLNAIQYFIVKNKRELSEEYLAKFSQLVRLFFEYSKYEQLSIAKEVDLLERYLEIEKIRFEDKLEYSISVDDRIDTDEIAVPSMILQPILENAVNHGIFHKQGNGKVELRFDYVDENTIKVTVSDDGVGIEAMKQIQKKSMGTYRSKSSEVIKERLKILSENKLSPWYVNYSITDQSVLDNEQSGTLVEIVIIYK